MGVLCCAVRYDTRSQDVCGVARRRGKGCAHQIIAKYNA